MTRTDALSAVGLLLFIVAAFAAPQLLVALTR
jgi:hypothetical protein